MVFGAIAQFTGGMERFCKVFSKEERTVQRAIEVDYLYTTKYIINTFAGVRGQPVQKWLWYYTISTRLGADACRRIPS